MKMGTVTMARMCSSFIWSCSNYCWRAVNTLSSIFQFIYNYWNTLFSNFSCRRTPCVFAFTCQWTKLLCWLISTTILWNKEQVVHDNWCHQVGVKQPCCLWLQTWLPDTKTCGPPVVAPDSTWPISGKVRNISFELHYYLESQKVSFVYF